MHRIYRLSQPRSIFGVVAVSLLMLTLSACNKGQFKPGTYYRAPAITEGAPTSSYMTPDGRKINLEKISDDYKAAKTNTADDAARQARDKIINQFLFVSDRACGYHLASVSANNAVANFTLGSITSLTAGLAAFVGSGATPQALSASAAFASGSRSLMNETFYSQQVGPVITKVIRENRETLGQALREKLAKPADQYTIDEALYDVGRYHESCSFYIGVELIDRAVATQRKTKTQLDTDIAELEQQMKRINEEIKGLDTSSLSPSDKQASISNKLATLKALEESRKVLMTERITAPNG